MLADAIAVRARVPKRAGHCDHVSVDLRVAERRLQLPDPHALLRKTSGDNDLRWHFATLRWLNPLLSEGWLRLDGEADVVADLKMRDGRLVAGSRAQLLRAQLQAEFRHGGIRAGDGVAPGRTRADENRFHRATIPPGAARRAVAGLRAGPRLEARAGGLRRLARFRRTMHANLRFDDAVIPDLRAYNRSLPGKSLRFEGGSGKLAATWCSMPRARCDMGGCRLHGQQAVVRFGPSRIVGNLNVDTRLHARRVAGIVAIASRRSRWTRRGAAWAKGGDPPGGRRLPSTTAHARLAAAVQGRRQCAGADEGCQRAAVAVRRTQCVPEVDQRHRRRQAHATAAVRVDGERSRSTASARSTASRAGRAAARCGRRAAGRSVCALGCAGAGR